MLAHKAEEDGVYAAEQIADKVKNGVAKKSHEVSYHGVPSVVYTHPEVGVNVFKKSPSGIWRNGGSAVIPKKNLRFSLRIVFVIERDHTIGDTSGLLLRTAHIVFVVENDFHN